MLCKTFFNSFLLHRKSRDRSSICDRVVSPYSTLVPVNRRYIPSLFKASNDEFTQVSDYGVHCTSYLDMCKSWSHGYSYYPKGVPVPVIPMLMYVQRRIPVPFLEGVFMLIIPAPKHTHETCEHISI